MAPSFYLTGTRLLQPYNVTIATSNTVWCNLYKLVMGTLSYKVQGSKQCAQ